MRAEVYDQFAESLGDHWWSASRRALVGALLGDIGVRPDGRRRVLEIGCGSGTEHAFLSGYGPVTGVELHEAGLRHCRERGYAALVAADLGEYEPEAGAFDLVFDLHVLYHAAVRDPGDVLRRLHRGLSPEGLLVVTEPAAWLPESSHDAAVMTARRWTRRALRAELERAGFEVVKLTGFMASLWPIALVERTWERVRPGASDAHIAELDTPPAWIDALVRGALGVERAVARRAALPIGIFWAAVARPRR
jgi:SAM-dependent methyltransferase